MAYIGTKPADKPLTSADITDSIITSAKIVDGTIANADIANTTIDLTAKVTGTLPTSKGGTGLSTIGTANQVLAVNSGATALEFQSVSSDFVLLQSTTASNVASVTMGNSSLLTSTYRTYMFIGSNIIPATDGANSRIRVSIGGSAQTGSNYYSTKIRMYDGSGTVTGYAYNTATSFEESWGESIGNSTGENANFVCYLFDPSSTNNYKGIKSTAIVNDLSPDTAQHIFAGMYYSTSAVDGLQFFFSSGNITSGYFKLYGLK